MTEIVLPRLGWTMEEGVFMGWLKRDGDSVKAGEPLYSVEGDKAVQEIESIASGTLHIAVDGPKEGDTIPVGKVIGRIGGATVLIPEGSQILAGGQRPPVRLELATDPGGIAERVCDPFGIEDKAHGSGGLRPPANICDPSGIETGAVETRRHEGTITPRARKAASVGGIDLAGVTGTGRNGRIRERDIPVSTRPSPLRQIIAQRMVHSARTTAPVTLTAIVDAENLANLRGQFKAASTDGVVPSFTDFFIKLTALALRKHPDLNARWHDDGIVAQSDIHIGLAVDTPVGLLVPVVREVPGLSLRQLAAATVDLAERARTRKLKPEEMQGGTFTITNLGGFGIDAFTPIINWPECAILGIGEIRKRPTVVGDVITGRHAVTLNLTFDHRIVDGAPAARFLKTLRAAVENPSAWLLD